MKKLYILGSGGLGREVLLYTKNNSRLMEEYEFAGFLDDLDPTPRAVNGVNVIGDTSILLDSEEEVGVIIAIGCRYIRKEKFEKLKTNKNISFPNMIANDVNIDESINLGIGNIILGNVNLTVNVELGDFNLIYLNSVLTHDVKLGNYISMYTGVTLSGAVEIEDFSELGTGAIVIPNVKVAAETIVGAGAVVVRDTEGKETIVGIPAKQIKKND